MTTHQPWPWPETMYALLAASASHRVLLDNDLVRVLEVVIEPGARTRAHPPGAQRHDRRRACSDQATEARNCGSSPRTLRVPARRAGALDGTRGPALGREHRRPPLPRDPRRTQVRPGLSPRRSAGPGPPAMAARRPALAALLRTTPLARGRRRPKPGSAGTEGVAKCHPLVSPPRRRPRATEPGHRVPAAYRPSPPPHVNLWATSHPEGCPVAFRMRPGTPRPSARWWQTPGARRASAARTQGRCSLAQEPSGERTTKFHHTRRAATAAVPSMARIG
jgi:hypothetical protein